MHAGMDKFPRTGFKVMAGSQLATGLLCFLLGIIDLCLSIRSSVTCRYYGTDVDRIYDDNPDTWPESKTFESYGGSVCGPSQGDMMGLCATGIWVGIMFVITGSLGVGAARTIVTHRQSGLKMGFMVLNIINTLMTAPALLGIGAMEAIFGGMVDEAEHASAGMHIGFGIVFAVLGFAMFVLCIVSASVSCCCAPTIEYTAVPVMQVVQSPATLAYGPAPILRTSPTTDDKAGLITNEI